MVGEALNAARANPEGQPSFRSTGLMLSPMERRLKMLLRSVGSGRGVSSSLAMLRARQSGLDEELEGQEQGGFGGGSGGSGGGGGLIGGVVSTTVGSGGLGRYYGSSYGAGYADLYGGAYAGGGEAKDSI